MGRFFDRRGRAIDGLAWARLKSSAGGRAVLRTEFDDGGLVRTTWEDWGPGDPPGIFLTAIFLPSDTVTPSRIVLAATEAEARADHAEAVENQLRKA